MKTVLLKQTKPQQATIFGYVVLAFIPVLLYFNENSISQIFIFSLIGLVLVSYSTTYEINEEFQNFKRIQLFGFTIWKEKLTLFYPDYISLFSASFKKDNNWGSVAALGTQSKNQNLVIKLFKGHKNEIIYKSNDYNSALRKANELGALLNVKVHNALKE